MLASILLHQQNVARHVNPDIVQYYTVEVPFSKTHKDSRFVSKVRKANMILNSREIGKKR